MSDEMRCPDCGGVVGGTNTPGAKTCTCFAHAPGATAVADAPISAPPTADEKTATRGGSSGKKLCRSCGKNLSGHKRFRTSKGYLCAECDADERANAPTLIPCFECKRRVKASALVAYRGNQVCKRCYIDHRDNDRVKVDKVELTKHDGYAKKQVIVLGVVALVLGVVILISLLK